MKTILTSVIALWLCCISALAQESPTSSPDDWATWLEGEWEGTSASSRGVNPLRQSFERTDDGQYILTELEFGSQPDVFSGFGVFQYFPERDSAFGNFFDMNGVTNDGWAKRFGDRMVWHIDSRRRGGRTITRIRERISDDEYVVTNYSTAMDGTRSRSVERMRRVAKSDR